MEVYTIQLCRHKLLTGSDITLLDTTVKSGVSPLAPTWKMVMDYKDGVSRGKGTVATLTYVSLYRALIKQRYRDNPKPFDAICTMDKVAIACMCRSGKFCHRYLSVQFLEILCTIKGLPFDYKGEILNVKDTRTT